MLQELRITNFSIIGNLTVAFGLTLLVVMFAASPVHAMPCTLYKGDFRLEALKKAKEELSERLQRQPVARRDYCKMAYLEYRLSRWQLNGREDRLNRCMEYANQVIQQDQQAAAAYFLRGLCLGRLGQMEGLWSSTDMLDPYREDMEKAVELDPSLDYGGPHRALGRLHFELPFFLGGDLEKSIKHLETAVSLGPDYWENHFHLGESYLSDDRYPEAKQALEKARRLSESEINEPQIEKDRARIRELLSEVESRMD